MMTRFHKMHGLGNDFVVIDARTQSIEMKAELARAIGNRQTGVGFDQLILIEPSETADVKMRFFNPDGSEVGACGNGTRAAAMLIGGALSIETQGGLLSSTAIAGGASVDMGHPRFEWDHIPLAFALDTAQLPVAWDDLSQPSAVNVGNPHVIFFVPDCDTVDLDRLGPIIENDPLFPERINVNIASIAGPAHLKLRVWERGAGLTLACGTGACATAVAAIKSGRVSSPVTVSLPGGDLEIAWQAGGTIRMTGPATHVFTGEADWGQSG
jgi:diaminopimelate epimerase